MLKFAKKYFQNKIDTVAEATDYEMIRCAENSILLVLMGIIMSVSIVFLFVTKHWYDFFPTYTLSYYIGVYIICLLATVLLYKTKIKGALQSFLIGLILIAPYFYALIFIEPFVGEEFIVAYTIYLFSVMLYKSDHVIYLIVIFSMVVTIVLYATKYQIYAHFDRMMFSLPSLFCVFLAVVIAANIIIFNRRRIWRSISDKRNIMQNYEELSTRNEKISLLLSEVKEKNNILSAKQKEIVDAYYSDPLTGLSNRVHLEEHIAKFDLKDKTDETYVFVFIDIDRFKYINDILGQDIGDYLLIEISKRISEKVEEETFVCRMSGDEFLVICQLEDESVMTSRISTLAELLRQPYNVNGTEFELTTSIGVSTYPRHGDNGHVLIVNAEIAMQEIKETGRNRVGYYSPKYNSDFEKTKKIAIEISKAVDNDELTLNFQPMLDLSTNKITHMEALLRWHSKELGFVPPDEFIPIAEASGQIKKIGRWVIEHAIIAKKQISEALGKEIGVSINVSSYELESSSFVSYVLDNLAKYDVDPSQIVIELTEGTTIRLSSLVMDRLTELSKHGIKISLDDVGSGYFNFNYLQTLPINEIKLDRMLLMKASKSEDYGYDLIVKLMHPFKMLGFKIVVEGVETREQLKFIQEAGFDTAQGYLIAKPMPIDQLIAFGEECPHCHDRAAKVRDNHTK